MPRGYCKVAQAKRVSIGSAFHKSSPGESHRRDADCGEYGELVQSACPSGAHCPRFEACRLRRWVEGGLWPAKIQQHHIRTLLHSFEDNFAAVRGDVEVAN